MINYYQESKMNSKNTQQVINKCFYDETIKIVKYIYEISNEDKLDFKELEKKFKDIWFEENEVISENPNQEEKPKKTVKKPIKKSVKKPLEEIDQCIALKKDGQRCKGKKLKNGKNPLICSLHNNSGIKNGTIIKNEDEEKDKCGYAYKSKERVDTSCENDKDYQSDNCKLHDAVLDTVDISSEESSYEEEFS